MNLALYGMIATILHSLADFVPKQPARSFFQTKAVNKLQELFPWNKFIKSFFFGNNDNTKYASI